MQMIQTIKRQVAAGIGHSGASGPKKAGDPMFLLFVVASLTSCHTCGNSIRSQAVSAGGELTARQSERNCGATTDYSSVVNLQNSSETFDPDEGVIFVARGRQDISVKWTGKQELLVSCPSCSRKNIFREVSVIGDIDVSYVLDPQ
jgi:hypothetical protein